MDISILWLCIMTESRYVLFCSERSVELASNIYSYIKVSLDFDIINLGNVIGKFKDGEIHVNLECFCVGFITGIT